MIPSVLATEIQASITDFLKTEFRSSSPGFEDLIDRFLDNPEAIFKGPYLSASLPFKSGSSGIDYFSDVPMAFPPHRHQEQAFGRLQHPNYRSTIVATGTGSGKTECFMMPILDHCFKYRGEPGIKAILIYPMNALATDQAKRLAQLIWHNSNLKGYVTAGLFVGESEREPTSVMTETGVITSKDILRQSPPDILLTNYKMLDYLLIRPKDQGLWVGNSPETLRYLVVDEIHTFDGAQGTDLACLIRRLKARLQTPANHLACVGTSATLGGNGKDEDTAKELLNYAGKIFNEKFDNNAIVTEDRLSAAEFLADAFIDPQPVPSPDLLDSLLPQNYDSVEKYIRAQYQLWFNYLLEDDWDEIDWRIDLGDRLKSLPIVHNLLKILSGEPTSLPSLWTQLNRKMRLPESKDTTYQIALLTSLAALFSLARDINNRPWANIRIQLWLRELRRMVANVSNRPELTFADDLTNEEQGRNLPLVHCRECGATGWGGLRRKQSDRQISCNLKDFYQAFFGKSPLISFIFPAKEKTGIPRQEEGERKKLCSNCLSLNIPSATYCHTCGSEQLLPVTEPNQIRENSHKGTRWLFSSHDCPFCNTKDNLAILGSRAASLASAAIGTLFASSYNDDRKLITFSDSVQDAAHRAGFFAARTFRTTLRTALKQYLDRQGNSKNLEQIIPDFKTYWRQELGSDTDYVATFIPSDLEWLEEWEELKQKGTCSTNLKQLCDRRLDWEIISELSLKTAFGGSLEKTGTCAITIQPQRLERATENLLLKLHNEIEGLRHLTAEKLQQFLIGILYHLRQKGAILHSLLESYIEQDGNIFLLQRPLFMPNMGPSSLKPSYPIEARNHQHFEPIIEKITSWWDSWAFKHCFDSEHFSLFGEQLPLLYRLVFDTLVEAEILGDRFTNKNAKVWGINLAALQLDTQIIHLSCFHCRHSIVGSATELAYWQEMSCLQSQCQGRYQIDNNRQLNFYKNLYSKGNVWHIFAQEHTGLLEREVREELERRFINSQNRFDTNLLSATSTLEMGIDIGDLSSVLLCSVPPQQANYQQRIGRAGRRDGNALVATIANGTNHDLYFWSNPLKMIAGGVETPGCYLDASAILQRQLTAYCLDCWITRFGNTQDLPEIFNRVLASVQQGDLNRFPYTWLNFIDREREQLLNDFIRLFAEEIGDRTQQQLEMFISQGERDEGGLRWRILNRLQEVVEERKRLQNQIKQLARRIKDKENGAKSLNHEDELENLKRERKGFMDLVKRINNKNTLNFFTDEGLLPNYAFPEAGVTLKSIIWRRRNTSGNSNTGKYETFTFEYERPSALAIGELVPSGKFYAEGRRVNVDQIDLNLSEIEEWRFCRNCSYAVPNIYPEAKQKTCPRCGDVMWSDEGRKRKMIRLRQVMATTKDRDSRIGDDRDERTPAFFTRQLLADFDPIVREQSYLIDEEEFPFGFEFLSRVTFREINFGQITNQAETVEIAGVARPRAGFTVCRSCGKVQNGGNSPNHTLACIHKNSDASHHFIDVLYLFRQFESEAIRMLLPLDTLNSPTQLHSFIAALQLGLKLHFQGGVDHLRTLISEEPSPNSSLRRPFLFLYDTVPGGTGYLKQLLRNRDELIAVFAKALTVLRSCSCEDGCYDCVFAYRNSFERDRTSRHSAIAILNAIVTRKNKITTLEPGLSTVKLNALFDSVLEQRFIDALSPYRHQDRPTILRKDVINGKSGYRLTIGEQTWQIEPQVELNQNNGVAIPCRADFIFYPAKESPHIKPIAIFTDGWEYHCDRLTQDFQQRMAIAKSGNFHIWSLTWSDVESQFNSQAGAYVNLLTQDISNVFRTHQNQLYQQYNCEQLRHLQDKDSFVWLINYLSNPDRQLWQRWALLRTLAYINHQVAPDSNLWIQEVSQLTDSKIIQTFDLNNSCRLAIVNWKSTQQNNLINSYFAIAPPRHKSYDGKGSLVVISIDDRRSEIDDETIKAWTGVLRQYNLFQFLDYSYIVTASGSEDETELGQFLLVPPTDREIPSSNSDPIWEQIRTLVFERDAIALIDYMAIHNWQVPEVGYELTDDTDTVIAEAELAWSNRSLALALDASETEIFTQKGWQIFTIAEVLNNPEAFYHQHLAS